MATFEIVEQEGKRFVMIGLENETVRAGSGVLGTMSYCRTYAGPGRLLVSRAPIGSLACSDRSRRRPVRPMPPEGKAPHDPVLDRCAWTSLAPWRGSRAAPRQHMPPRNMH